MFAEDPRTIPFDLCHQRRLVGICSIVTLVAFPFEIDPFERERCRLGDVLGTPGETNPATTLTCLMVSAGVCRVTLGFVLKTLN